MKKILFIGISVFIMAGLLPAKVQNTTTAIECIGSTCDITKSYEFTRELDTQEQMVQSQEAIDTAIFRAVYEHSYKTNPEQIEFNKTDLMYLDIGRETSKFYSRHTYIRDSIAKHELSKEVSAFEVNNKIKGLPRGTSSVIYYLDREGNRREYTGLSLMFIFYDEIAVMPKWKIENSTKVIDGFKCHKATTSYLGREWIVYYSPEIPIHYGPWKLWGLPGLILEATDSNSYFSYKLTGFERLNQRVPIELMDNSYISTKYEQKNKDTFQRIQKLYYTANDQFMELFLDAKLISATNEDGTKLNKSRPIPHIPLEPW